MDHRECGAETALADERRGEVAARDVAMIDIRCGRCDRHGRLSVKRLLARYGPDASLRDIMHEQIGSCPHPNDTQLYTRCALLPDPGAAVFPIRG